MDPDEPFGPSEADLAEMFGGGVPVKEEDETVEAGSPLPDIEAVRQKVPVKTQVLMEELFRAKLAKVQRVNPKKIR